jgi:hypothetical protein
MTLHYKRFIPFSPEKEGNEEAFEIHTSPSAKAAKVAKAAAYEKLARSDLVGRYAASESARVFLPSINGEVWIASDVAEATRLREELACEGDARPVIVAADVVKLQGEPQVEVDAAIRTLAAFPGARVVYAGPIRPEGAVRSIPRRRAAPAPWGRGDEQ